MIQASLEGNFSSREDTLLENKPVLTTTDVIILGEDAYSTETSLDELSPDFIGPHDATDEARPLLEKQAKNLAMVAVMNIAAYGREYGKVVTAARHSVSEGLLHLNSEFSHIGLEQQVDAFISKNMMSEYKSHDEVAADLEVERTAQNLGPKHFENKLQKRVGELEEDAKTRLNAFVKARALLAESGASAEFMKKFDHTAGLMRTPESDAYKNDIELDRVQENPPLVDTGEVRLSKIFKDVLGASFGHRALRSIGVLSPKSGEIKVVEQHDSTSR